MTFHANRISKQKIFCISAGQKDVKKSNSKIHKKNLYLNYGLLSLASILKKQGFDPLVIHGHFESPERVLKTCIEKGLDNSNVPVLISIPSFYAVSWVIEFIKELKLLMRQKKVILGGRWVIDDQIEQSQELIQDADYIIPGLSESRIVNIVMTAIDDKHIHINENISPNHSTLDYSLLHNRSLYHPSIEISRGCGMGCTFCQEKNEKLTNLKPARKIIDEVKRATITDSLAPMNFYFETSIFAPNKTWINDLIDHRRAADLEFKWRTEARVDSIKEEFLKPLHESGLRVIDLGLESASPQQLKRMQKTKKPESYLQKASALIITAYKLGIMVKVNILISAGETTSTLKETTDWLDKHRDFIKGVSVGPVIVFGWENKVQDYLNEIEKYGAKISHKPITGITHIHPSEEIDHKKALELSSQISRRYMSAKDYFDLKTFCYFSRDYTFTDFKRDLKHLPKENQSFSKKLN